MIYTVTLNPAIDKTLKIDDFKVDQVNRVKDYREDAGGKGINVTKMIYKLKGDSIAVMITGGDIGHRLTSLLDDENISYKAIKTPGQTRINIKVVDHNNHTFTDINEKGPDVDRKTLETLDAYLINHLSEKDILVLAGSLPQGVPKDIYKHWCELGKEKGAKVILDADRDVLELGIKGLPWIIKPNQNELEMYFGKKFDNDQDMILKAHELVDMGIYAVVISQGEKGCLVVSKDGTAKIDALKLNVVSTVGAGDSMVAGIAFGIDEVMKKNETLDFARFMDIMRLGVASSSASIEEEGTHMGSLTRVNELYQEITVNMVKVSKLYS